MATAKEDSGYVDNWQRGKTVTECNLHMLTTEDCCDVTFRVGSEKRVVRAHRYVLVSRSCVFHAMFCGPLAEKGEVTIPDIAPSVFKDFLRYLYSDTVELTAENVTGLLYTSRKYAVDGLFSQCTSYLEKSLSEHNVCQILEDGHGYGEVDLEQKALKILTEGGANVIKSPGFLDLCDTCLSKFLKSEDLNLTEEEIFEATLSWAKEKCKRENQIPSPENIRKTLGDMRFEVRFTVFPQEYLSRAVGPSGILTRDERLCIMDKKYDSDIDIAPFKSCQRKSKTENINSTKCLLYATNRYESVSGTWYCGVREDISFSVNRNIILIGCQLYGPSKPSELNYELEIVLYDDHDEVIAEPVSSQSWLLKGQTHNDVFFPDPISVEPGRMYTVCVTMEGENTLRGDHGQTAVSKAGVVFTFHNSTKPGRGCTDVRKGQIPGLIWRLRDQL